MISLARIIQDQKDEIEKIPNPVRIAKENETIMAGDGNENGKS